MDYGARLVVGFVLNPILVAGLGDYGYGLWQVLGRMIGHISPASGRPSQALKFTIANKQASSDFPEKRRQVGNAIAVWMVFLPFFALLGSLLSWFAPSWLGAPKELVWTVRLVAGMLVINQILVSLVHIPRSVLEGENLGYKRMGLSAAVVCVGGVLTYAALRLGFGLVGVASAYLAATLLTGLLFVQVVYANVSWFGVSKPSLGEVRGFFKLSGWFIVWRLVMQLLRESDVVLLGLLVSTEMVTTYTLTKYIPETMINVAAIVIFGIIPGMGGIIGSGNLKKAARVRNEIMIFTWLLATAVGSSVLLLNKSFLQLWVGSGYDAGPIATLLVIIMMAQLVLIRNDANVIDLTLNLRGKVLLGLSSASISLLLAGVLVIVFQVEIAGMCAGLIAGRLLLSLSYPMIVGRFLGIRAAAQFKHIARPTAVTAGLFGAAIMIREFILAPNWIVLTLFVGASVSGTLLVSIFAGLSGQQRFDVWQRCRQVLIPARAT